MTAQPTYTLIATQNLTSATGIVTFSSIPQAYTDLLFVVAASVSSSWDISAIRAVLGGTNITSGYSRTYFQGPASTPTTGRATSEISLRGGYLPPSSSSTFSADNYHFLNYSNSTTYKTVLCRTNSVNTGSQGFNTQIQASLIPSTGAITQITIQTANGANLSSGSTFNLYGITAA